MALLITRQSNEVWQRLKTTRSAPGLRVPTDAYATIRLNQKIYTAASGEQACTFNTLNEQRSYYNLEPQDIDCPFPTGTCLQPNCNLLACSTPCVTYPTTYMSGTQGCRYPMTNA